MLTSELVNKLIGEDKVSGIINDPDYTESIIIDLLNEVQLEIAGGGERQHGLPLLAPLPRLLSSDTISLTSSANSVSMPSTYHRGPVAIIDSQDFHLTELEQHLDFLRSYPVLETGTTVVFCIKGDVLFYAPSQTQTVTAHFYRFPVEMTDNTASEPDGIPSHLQSPLLVSGVCFKVFSAIEDGVEGNKVNTSFWFNRYQSAQTALERFIGPVDKLPESVQTSGSDYIGHF